MTTTNDLIDVFIQNDVEEILNIVEEILKEDYTSGNSTNIWEDNELEIEGLISLFESLQREGLIGSGMTLHISVDGSDSSYEETSSRYILFDGIKPIFIEWFDKLFYTRKYMYLGLKKESFKNLIHAALKYQKHNVTSIVD